MSKIAIILALPIEYNTSSMLRCRTLINAMVKLGHDIRCYTPNPDPASKYYSSSLSIESIELFRYGKVIRNGIFATTANEKRKTIKERVKSLAYRIFKKLDVFGATLLYLPEQKKIAADIGNNSFDYMISFSDPMTAHMIGKYCKKKNKNLTYIQQWGDPLASDTISKIAQPVWFRKLVESSLLSSADRVCYVSPFTNEEQKKIFSRQANKMIFLPTPSLVYDENEVERKGSKLCLGYFGSYNSVARNLLPFYNAAAMCPDVDFIIIGDSDLNLENTSNVQVLERVSQEELAGYIKEIDVIVCLMNHKGNQIPGKVYHDAASKKDILLIKDGEYGDRIEQFFASYNHYTFVANNETEIIKIINKYKEEGIPVRKAVSDFKDVNIARALLGIKE